VCGVARMVDEDRPCIDVLTQIAAARSALEHVSLSLLDEHARGVMLREGAVPDGSRQPVEELIDTVGRILER
jgi:CsoR family transcriptional regulator, copper-sensing transcriptional repressor